MVRLKYYFGGRPVLGTTTYNFCYGNENMLNTFVDTKIKCNINIFCVYKIISIFIRKKGQSFVYFCTPHLVKK